MSDRYQDPLKKPVNQLHEPRFFDMDEWKQTNTAGPGGKSTITENNEKGILDHTVLRVMDPVKMAALGSTHDAHGQGVYREVGDEYAD